jgi:putative transposase
MLMPEYKVNYKSNNNVVFSCKYHVVWCSKYRRDVLVNGADDRLKEIIHQVYSETRSAVLEMEVMPNHVHLLVEVDPQFGIHHLIKLIKGRSSRLLRQEFRWCRTRLPSLWTNSYFVSTVGGAPMEIIGQYIESNKRRVAKSVLPPSASSRSQSRSSRKSGCGEGRVGRHSRKARARQTFFNHG